MNRTNEEVRNEILKRANELDIQTKKRKRIIYYCIPAAVCIAVFLLASADNLSENNNISVLQTPYKTDKFSNISAESYIADTKTSETEKAKSNIKVSEKSTEQISAQPTTEPDITEIRLFKASAANPDSDSFGEDELQHIDVIIHGSIVYRQLPIEHYAEYGFRDNLYESDFGEFIGNITEISDSDTTVEAGAKEPGLKGGSVFYYGNNKSAVIVKKDELCSIFVFDQYTDRNKIKSLKETYALYGASSGNDIDYLNYTVHGISEGKYIQTEKGTVRDRNKIENFYKITSELVPFKTNDPIAMTPGWLVKAQEDYNKHPENFIREDFDITIHFKNGAVLKDIGYKPYIATGYVSHMELLTPEQNKELRKALSGN